MVVVVDVDVEGVDVEGVEVLVVVESVASPTLARVAAIAKPHTASTGRPKSFPSRLLRRFFICPAQPVRGRISRYKLGYSTVTARPLPAKRLGVSTGTGESLW